MGLSAWVKDFWRRQQPEVYFIPMLDTDSRKLLGWEIAKTTELSRRMTVAKNFAWDQLVDSDTDATKQQWDSVVKILEGG